MAQAETTVDVLIVGAGLSGIGAAAHLTMQCPNKSYAIVEQRANMGGTWDLFRYPGIRSDSDMHTLGYRFKPWFMKRRSQMAHPFTNMSMKPLRNMEFRSISIFAIELSRPIGQAQMPAGM